MSIDRLQSKAGMYALNPEPAYGTTGTGSTAASLQYPGGVQFGREAGFAPALATSAGQGGGALYMQPVPYATKTGSFGQAISETGTISHFNAGFVGLLPVTTMATLQMQPPSYAGQVLFVLNAGAAGNSISVATTGTVANWSTTGTTAVKVCEAAWSLDANTIAMFVAAPHAVTTTNVWPVALWKKII